MKYLSLILIIFIYGAMSMKTDEPCKIVQRYYLKGKLVQELIRDSTITEHGCLNYYSINGRDIWSDSIVTGLK